MADLYHLGDGYTVQIKLSRGFPLSFLDFPTPSSLPLAAPRTEHHFLLKGVLPCTKEMLSRWSCTCRRSLRNLMKIFYASWYLIAMSYLFPKPVSITVARGLLYWHVSSKRWAADSLPHGCTLLYAVWNRSKGSWPPAECSFLGIMGTGDKHCLSLWGLDHQCWYLTFNLVSVNIHMHIHTNAYTYINICVCICVWVFEPTDVQVELSGQLEAQFPR